VLGLDAGGGGGGAGGGATTPQWKAAIDFKWIRDNRDAVATNILNRNSVANLDVVLQLYDQYLALQKVRELPVIATAVLLHFGFVFGLYCTKTDSFHGQCA
jgi:hypothetical protein